jgi:ketosteroid isomerase-like protein
MKPWEIFLEKYRVFGEKPSRESHARLFAPDATILHPGMSHPMPAAQYVDFFVEGLKRLPEFHLIPIHWAVRGDTIFVEARNTAVVKGRPIEWPAIYVVTLRDEMVIRGRPYYDRMEALAPFEPGLAGNVPNAHTTILEELEPHGSSAWASDAEAYETEVYDKIVAPYAANGKDPDPLAFQQFYRQDARMINPGFERPLRRDELADYYKSLKSQIRNLQLHLGRWAVSPELLFIEWTVTGQVLGRNLFLPNCDRFTLHDMLAIEGVAYFDNLALRTFFEPNLSRFTNASFANLATGNDCFLE